jgi:hypothetical protein
MKTLILLLSILSPSIFAQEIQGTLVLKGILKTKIRVFNVETLCRVKVDKVKNFLEEDSYGNPGYQVLIKVTLDGRDSKRGLEVKFDKTFNMVNMHRTAQGTQVKDLEYFSQDGALLMIKEDGRMARIQFPYQGSTITCNF